MNLIGCAGDSFVLVSSTVGFCVFQIQIEVKIGARQDKFREELCVWNKPPLQTRSVISPIPVKIGPVIRILIIKEEPQDITSIKGRKRQSVF